MKKAFYRIPHTGRASTSGYVLYDGEFEGTCGSSERSGPVSSGTASFIMRTHEVLMRQSNTDKAVNWCGELT